MACRIYPKLTEYQLDQLPSEAEAKFYRSCIKCLPSNFLVLHSVSLIYDGRKGAHHVGESDFVIFDPNSIMLVVEVKGGGIEHDPKIGPQWQSINRFGKAFEIKDPFAQSENNRFKMLGVIKSKVKSLTNKHIPAGHSVAFPDIAKTDLGKFVSPTRPRSIIACEDDLHDLHSWFKRATHFWIGDNETSLLNSMIIQDIERAFLKPISARKRLSKILEEEESERIKFTDDQSRLLLCLSNHNRVNIHGGAGTGKTVMATKLADDFSQTGMSVAFICYNSALGSMINSNFKNNNEVLSDSYHRFFRSLLGNSLDIYFQQAKDAYPDSDAWSVIYPMAYTLALEEVSEFQFDAIIIDEAQDFSPEMWLPIEMLLKKDQSKFFLFSDTNQSLYSESDHVPILSPPFLLHTNCRNTKNIHNEAYLSYSGPSINPPDISGEPVFYEPLEMISDQRDFIISKVDELVQVDKIHQKDIIILVANSENFNSFYDQLLHTKSKYNFIAEEFTDSDKVCVSTIKKFKGLESAVVILWGLNDLPVGLKDNLKYVGLTRSKSICYVVN